MNQSGRFTRLVGRLVIVSTDSLLISGSSADTLLPVRVGGAEGEMVVCAVCTRCIRPSSDDSMNG